MWEEENRDLGRRWRCGRKRIEIWEGDGDVGGRE
jgi:hypothetical protein